MALDLQTIVQVYQRRAPRYDLTANLCYLLGFRLGTGLNIPLLQRAIGAAGHIIGVDLADAMLAQAQRRIEREGWRNFDLVSCDAARYECPGRLGGSLSTFALMLVPEYESVIERGARTLAPGRRWVVADLKLPEWPGARLCGRALVPFYRPFAVTLDLAERRPWESIARQMKIATVSPRFLGFAYVATGEA